MEDCSVEERFTLRLIEVPGVGLMAVIADADVVGRVEEDRERGVRIEISPAFYGEEVVCLDEAREALVEASILVLSGPRIVELAGRMGLVNPDSVLTVNGLPHVQVYKFRF